MDKNLSQKKKRKNDIVLAVVIILLATAGLLLFNLTKDQGDYVIVKVDGVEKYRYSLNEDVDTVIYTGKNNEGTNRLIIKDGEAYVSQANCPDKICAEHKPISNANESIICLPHRVSVEIISASSSEEPDIIV